MWCTRVLVCVFFLSFSLSNSFSCALWCSMQVIVHVHVGLIPVPPQIYKCMCTYKRPTGQDVSSPAMNLNAAVYWHCCDWRYMYVYILYVHGNLSEWTRNKKLIHTACCYTGLYMHVHVYTCSYMYIIRSVHVHVRTCMYLKTVGEIAGNGGNRNVYMCIYILRQ